jgi:hypothetical protein
MPKKAKGGKKKGAEGPPGDYPIGKSKEKTVEAELNQERSRFASLQAELIVRTDESSRVLAELRIAEKQREAARADAAGMGQDIVSVQRDFARLFRVKFILSLFKINHLACSPTPHLTHPTSAGSAANTHRSNQRT